VLLTIWTWLLVEPNPVPDNVRKILSVHDLLPFLAAKSLHMAGYAVLALLLHLTLPGTQPSRIFAVSLLMLHGLGTEFIQTLVPNRSGHPRDVLIDWFGIAMGTGLAGPIHRRLG
jgi:VanZ family protein